MGIVRYMAARRVPRVRIKELEHELREHTNLSRSAFDNAIDVLASAGLLRLTKADGVRVGEVQMPRVWAKLGELFEVEQAAVSPAGVGMPWLAEFVADMPRRQRLRPQPAAPDSELSTDAVEAALAMIPQVERAPATRRAPAPGRRK